MFSSLYYELITDAINVYSRLQKRNTGLKIDATATLLSSRKDGDYGRFAFAAEHAVWMCPSLPLPDRRASLAKTGDIALIMVLSTVTEADALC